MQAPAPIVMVDDQNSDRPIRHYRPFKPCLPSAYQGGKSP